MRAYPVKNVSQQCDCKKGYRSRLDAKCDNCRTKSDRAVFNKFWDEVEKQDCREGEYLFNRLRAKHFGFVYYVQ